MLMKETSSLQQIEQFIEQQTQLEYQENDLIKDCELREEDLVFELNDQENEKGILLTGCTGFLGIFLLLELVNLVPSDWKILCLIQPKPNATTEQRLLESFRKFGISIDKHLITERIECIEGDLSSKWLGLGNKTKFMELAKRIRLIVHNGAWVNHLLDYTSLKSTNVEGTKEIIRLAFAGGKNRVQLLYISTLSTIPHDLGERKEEFVLTNQQPLTHSSGYSQTKWVAERLVTESNKKGLSTIIFRLGTLSGHSQTGLSMSLSFL